MTGITVQHQRNRCSRWIGMNVHDGPEYAGTVQFGSLETLDAALDDVLDAAACLLTAKRIREGRAVVLGDRSVDAKELRMEIVA